MSALCRYEYKYDRFHQSLHLAACLSPIEAPLRVWVLEAEGRKARLHAFHLAPQPVHLHSEWTLSSSSSLAIIPESAGIRKFMGLLLGGGGGLAKNFSDKM